VTKAAQFLSHKRESFKKETENALSKLGHSHPASKHLVSILRAVDHRPPTKREKDLVHAIIPQQKPDLLVNVVWKQMQSSPWNTPCARCQETSSKVLSIILGFPVCDSCHSLFEQGFSNLVLADLDVELGEPRKPIWDRDPMGIADEEMDIEI
jgi:hypothetical protein